MNPALDVRAPDGPRIQTLGRVLRGLGATIVAASAGTFVFQQWQGSDDLTRYFALLAQAVVLSGAGFFCAVRIRESRSARTFMALAAGMMPALFAVLGGLVYSQLSLDGGVREVASYATWRAPSAGAAFAAMGATMVAAAPIAFLSFLSLARSQARVLTGAFLALNAVMLIPTRMPDVSAAIVAVALVGLVGLECLRFRGDSAMRTREGLIVRALLAVPVVLVVARSLMHYQASLYLASIGFFAVGGLLQLCRHALDENADGGAYDRSFGLDLASLVPLASGFATFSLATYGSFGLSDAMLIPVAALPVAGLLGAFSLRSEGRTAAGYQYAAVGVAFAAMASNLVVVPSVLAAFLALAFGVVAVGYGYYFDRRPLLVAGVFVSGYALFTHVDHAVRLYGHLHWTSLSALGIGVIFVASLLERWCGRHEAKGGRSEAPRVGAES